MLSGILIALGTIVLVLISRSLTTLFHELGHAIPALWFTRSPVQVYVGSYGDISKSLILRLGRLSVYLKFNILDWKLGMCQHRGEVTFLQHFIIILGGPLISLILAGLCLWPLLEGTAHPIALFFSCLFLLLTLWDFGVNILPLDRPIQMHDGTISYNDGRQLQNLWQIGSQLPDWSEALSLIEAGKTKEGIAQLEAIYQQSKSSRVLDLLVHQLNEQQQFERALSYLRDAQNTKQLKKHQQELLGDALGGLHRHAPALAAYNAYLHNDFANPRVLNKKVRLLTQMAEYQAALQEVHFSINQSPETNDEGYRLRAYLLIREEQFPQAKVDLERAAAINPDQAELYFYWGEYYDSVGDREQAFLNYQKAAALGYRSHQLDYKLGK